MNKEPSRLLYEHSVPGDRSKSQDEPRTSTIMFSTTISRRILGCLMLLALLSQYADARKSLYGESILSSLQRIENMIVKQIEQSTLNCLVPAEKLFSLFSDHLQTSSNESNETSSRRDPSSVILRRALDLQNDIQESMPKKQKHRRRSKNRNENVNSNINTNVNSNRHHGLTGRRALDDLSKSRNQNSNSNFNFNSNLNKNRDIFDFSDEDDEV